MSTFEFDDSSLSDLGGGHEPKVETADLGDAARGGGHDKPGEKARPLVAIGAPVAAKKQIYTVMAQQGVDAAQVVNTAMQKRVVGTSTPRRIEVIAPHGPSTSGGKKARQSITLVPVAGGGAAIVFGFLDVAAKAFEVRPHALVSQQFKARFGEPFEATPDEYAALVKDMAKILGTLGFKQGESREDTNPNVKLASAREADDADEEYDEEDVVGGPTRQQKLMLLSAGVVVTIIATLWWLK